MFNQFAAVPRQRSLYSKRRGSVCCRTELHILRILRNSDSSFESSSISMQPSSTALFRTCSRGLSIKLPMLRYVFVNTSYSNNLLQCLITDIMSLWISSSYIAEFFVSECIIRLIDLTKEMFPILKLVISIISLDCFNGLKYS